jgi:hypothetical protein
MTKLRAWVANLHVGQLIMLLLGCVLAAAALLLLAAGASSNRADARWNQHRAMDYSGYYSSQEDRLSNPDLWERKVDAGWSYDVATVYVANRPGGDTSDSRMLDSARQILARYTSQRQSATITIWLALSASLTAVAFCLWALWNWFGGRTRGSFPTRQL